MNTVAFFNNKSGVGKTTLVYHLAHMYAEQGETVLAVDLDPQSNLTSMFLTQEELESVWPDGDHPQTFHGALRPIIRGTGEVSLPVTLQVRPGLQFVAGDLALSTFEDKLCDAWPRCHSSDESAFRTMTAFYRGVLLAAHSIGATWVLIDVGPNLGAINRAVLIGSQYVVIPLSPDLFSLQGLRNLGPQIRTWRETWSALVTRNPDKSMEMPSGTIEPLGYVVLQHGVHEHRRAPKAYQRWIERIPSEYRTSVLNEPVVGTTPESANDVHCLAVLKHYRSLMPMAMEARKPAFSLKPADGAIGAHTEAVRNAHGDFSSLALKISERAREKGSD